MKNTSILLSTEKARYNSGYQDGKNSKKMNNPIHNNWVKGTHFDSVYETGYWAGYKG